MNVSQMSKTIILKLAAKSSASVITQRVGFEATPCGRGH